MGRVAPAKDAALPWLLEDTNHLARYHPSERASLPWCDLVASGLHNIPDVVQPLISERDQRRTADPLDPPIKLLDRDIQPHIRQEVQDQWRSLLESSDHVTNPMRYWFLLRKLGGKNPLPNIKHFQGDCTSLQQAVHCLFRPTRTGTQNVRRLMRDLHHHPVDPSFRPFDVRGVAAAIRKAGSSTALGPDGSPCSTSAI